MIDQLRKLYPVKLICRAFGVLRSSYYHSTNKNPNPDRIKLKVMIKSLFKQSRHSLGSRGIRFKLLNQGIKIGRYLVRKLMRESGLVSKQRKKHKYQSNVAEVPSVPNTLNRQFANYWISRPPIPVRGLPLIPIPSRPLKLKK